MPIAPYPRFEFFQLRDNLLDFLLFPIGVGLLNLEKGVKRDEKPNLGSKYLNVG